MCRSRCVSCSYRSRASSASVGQNSVGLIQKLSVHVPPVQEPGKLPFHADEVETRNVARLEFDQQVNIAVSAEVVSKNGAE